MVAYIKSCEACTKATPQLLRGPLQPLLSTRVMEIIEVDYFGPFPPSPGNGHRYKTYKHGRERDRDGIIKIRVSDGIRG